MQKLFEKWFTEQFGPNSKVILKNFNDEDGYEDRDANMMWMGFNAGFELSKFESL
jgi:hypothetical protein